MPAVPSVTLLRYPDREIALAGVTTPIGALALVAPAQADVTVIVQARTGALTADVVPGVIVSGGGSSSLWVAGPAAEVNARLATLTYAASAAGSDTLSIAIVDATGQTGGPVTIPVQVAPLITLPGVPDPVLALSGGTLTLDTRQVDGLTLSFDTASTAAGAATLVLTDTTFGADTRLYVATTDPAAAASRLAVARTVTLGGLIDFESGPALVTLAENAILKNNGQVAFFASMAQLIGPGTLENDGEIAVGADARPTFDVAITGSGDITIADGARLRLGDPAAASETIRFDHDAGDLELDAPQTMQATIEGFVSGDAIQLGEIHVDAADYTSTATGGILTLFDGAQIVARLTFAGHYALGDFRLSVATDNAGDGGAITTLSVLANPALAAAQSAAGVFRFFDTAHGTQLLTQNAAERDAILAHRPDLKFEGVAMQAIAAPQGDPQAAPIYRFFDTVHGTHFFTADVTEKNTLLATRPDLAFEPNSTIWEHAAQCPGDVPVYRFFDTATGAHFYTASASERASLLSIRPDFKAEGVAFYAPGD